MCVHEKRRRRSESFTETFHPICAEYFLGNSCPIASRIPDGSIAATTDDEASNLQAGKFNVRSIIG
jgi:hypothetical protein